MHYYFWTVIKNRVYFNFQPKSLAELEARIGTVIAEVDQEELRSAVFNLTLRLEMILENEGGTIEQLL